MNPHYHLDRLRDGLESDYAPGRERALVATKLDEAELWLTRCQPIAEALERDGKAQP
jgi:hypothetical protein